jgi:hypothetical protein
MSERRDSGFSSADDDAAGPMVAATETPAPKPKKLTLREQVAALERRLAILEARFRVADGAASCGETYHEMQQRFRTI